MNFVVGLFWLYLISLGNGRGVGGTSAVAVRRMPAVLAASKSDIDGSQTLVGTGRVHMWQKCTRRFIAAVVLESCSKMYVLVPCK